MTSSAIRRALASPSGPGKPVVKSVKPIAVRPAPGMDGDQQFACARRRHGRFLDGDPARAVEDGALHGSFQSSSFRAANRLVCGYDTNRKARA